MFDRRCFARERERGGGIYHVSEYFVMGDGQEAASLSVISFCLWLPQKKEVVKLTLVYVL